jgi:hypothetical protein
MGVGALTFAFPDLEEARAMITARNLVSGDRI